MFVLSFQFWDIRYLQETDEDGGDMQDEQMEVRAIVVENICDSIR